MLYAISIGVSRPGSSGYVDVGGVPFFFSFPFI